MPVPYEGGCQCGSVRYEIRGEPLALYVCHCTNCQKQSGSAFGMSLNVRPEDFVLVKGRLGEWRETAASGRIKILSFCRDCGTRILHRPQTGTGMNIKPGTLDDTRWLVPAGHIWTKSKQPWIAIPENTLAYETQPDDFGPIFQAWQKYRS